MGMKTAKFFYDTKGYPIYIDSKKLVHRAVAEKKVGGKIYKGNVVHHIDGNPKNFRKKNLQVMKRSSHSRLHARKRGRGYW